MIENLESVIDFIIDNDLIAKGDRVGVGVSAGADSMALLHFLHSLSAEAGFTVVAVNVNHSIRKESRKEAAFVSKFAKELGIDYVGISVDVPTFAKQHKYGIEQAARIKRYEAFAQAIKKAKLTKFAIAHHQSDQAETILFHIFRGSGLAGASGMEPKQGIYIRPFLETTKADIVGYNYRMQVPSMVDETNLDNRYSRNYIRNEIMPLLQKEWRGIEKNIVEFGKICCVDDDYINSIIDSNMYLVEENNVRIPLNLFFYHPAVVNRLVIEAFAKIGERTNIEKKHVELVATLAITGENGSKADLPNGLFAIKEYEYLAIVRKTRSAAVKIYPFKIGKTAFAEYGTITVSKTIATRSAIEKGLTVVDVDKLPRTSKWRTRKEGDTFTKFGGGTKTLAAHMIDLKIPARFRDKIPVLAKDNEIYAIAGVGVSDKVKVDHNTLEGYVIEIVKD